MQTPVQKGMAVIAAMLLTACGADQVTSSADVAAPRYFTTTPPPSVRFSEFHYDNAGTDVNERIEVSFPTGTSLADYSVVLYNGSNGAVYGTFPLSAAAVSQCSAERSVAVIATPGLQNGSPDGFAIAGPSGLVEFLSYEGTFAGVGGVANGVTSTDVGVSETGGSTFLADGSLQRSASGTWSVSLATNTFGSCNDGTTGGPTVGPVETVTVTPSTASVVITQTATLAASAVDASGLTVSGVSYTWSSANEAVATVSGAGVVTAQSLGTVEISATSENGKVGKATITVVAAPSLPDIRFSEIHYDNFGTDVGEFIEIEGPGSTNLTGWSVVLYNGNGGVTYSQQILSGSIVPTCADRGVVTVDYPQDGIQNGAPDGFALVDNNGSVVEFLSYEGTFTATNGPAAGMQSRDIVATQNSAPVGTSLQRSLSDTWASAPDNYGGCNGRTPRIPRVNFSFSGRDGSDPALPVGFQDQIFATVRVDGVVTPTTITWTSDTPAIATIDANGVVTGTGAGTAILRATTAEGKSDIYTLAIGLALPWAQNTYAGNEAFGRPSDGNAADEIILDRMEYTTSFSPTRGIPNWVSYNLEAKHIGEFDRCDCFTFDPELKGAGLAGYTTADYTGAGAVAGYGIDRGHLVRSFDRTAGALDNAHTFYFSNIIPQTADNNQGPWAALENALGDSARVGGREVYIIAGASGSIGTVKNEGKITIPSHVWKVAVIMPKDEGLAAFTTPGAATVLAVVMPNIPGIRNTAWTTYETTVDSVEALSGFDVLSLLNDQVEIAVESKTSAPVARVNGPFTILAGESVMLSASASADADGDALTYAWAFGDGRTAEGVNATVPYLQPGTFTVTATVTDTRGLIGTATTTVAVLNSAQGLAEIATMLEQLGATAKLNRGLANALAVKVRNAAASIDRESPEAARGQLNALLNEIDALVRSGRITAANAAPVRSYLVRVIASLDYGV
ncbi:DNA/RNA non-specific endonuclease [Gemmatimonas sp.]